MNQEQANIRLSTFEAILIIIIILGGVSFAIIKYEVVPHIPVILAIFLLFIYGILKKVSIKDLENGMIEGAKSGLGAVMIFFFIGMLISSWMASGTIPTFIYYALEFVNGNYFYSVVFVVTAIVGASIGSSLTTAATIGVAFISVSSAMELSLPITAGAIISGAFFGDKMSPLSDTTNLASLVAKVDLFEHIKNMMWTTVPAFIITFVLFAILSPGETAASFENMNLLKGTLQQLDLVHLYSLLPFVILAVMAFKKVSTIITLSFGVLSALCLSFFIQSGMNVQKGMNLLFSGYELQSGVEEIDKLLGQGGIESMMFSISLVLLALSLGGLLFKLGVIEVALEGISKFLYKAPTLVLSTVSTAIGINFLVGEQYLSILLTGNTFAKSFEKAKLHPKTLSRILEDAGTVVNPLVPWGVCGVFLTGVLGVETIDYLPYTFFCLLCPIITLLFGFSGFTIKKI